MPKSVPAFRGPGAQTPGAGAGRAGAGRAGAGRAGAGGRRFGLATRTVMVTCLVAVISVLVTASVSIPVALRAARQEARESLGNETALVALLLSREPGQEERVTRQLKVRDIELYLVRKGQPDRAGLPAAVLRAVVGGRVYQPSLARVGGRARLVAGRTLANRPDEAVVLTAEPVTGTAALLLRRLWWALLAGLLAGMVAGPLLGRWLARPLRGAVRAAARLTAGDRAVRLPQSGPAEVADLATSINGLAEALATSEGRQREFLLSVSHDLRTPLTSIRGYAEALADGVLEGADTRQAGQTMLAEAKRLDRLISDLLVLARLEADELPVKMIEVDLTQLVSAVGEAWAGRCAAGGIALRIELPEVPIPAYVDPERLRQIVDGLLDNAVRVVPPGTPVVVEVRPGAPTGYPGTGGYPVVEVRDGGPGFTDEDLAVAFHRGALNRRYQNTRKVGSGLGLALAAGLVRRLGGTIEAGHAPEGGARFTIALARLPASNVWQTGP